jgi:Tol biopolymer transport system component
MELVEGEDLAQRIARGPVALAEALSIGRQTAEALEAAHDHGIIHRDLKPANIKVRADATVKVLDFGLAKAINPASASASDAAMNSPTISLHATQAGIILGTAAYMAPEQARAKAVDKRADIWAFGCVLFEMLTGTRTFSGADATDTIVAVVTQEPDWATLPANIPVSVNRLLRRSLVKDPKQRLDSAAAARLEIDDASSAAPLIAAQQSRAWVIPAVAAIGLLVAGSIGWWLWRSPNVPAAPPVMTFRQLTLQEGVARDPAISPDGKWVVYVNALSGNQDIYLQSTTGQSTINLTKDSPSDDTTPAFSPDGDFIAFRSERDGGGLFVMGRTGESVRRLTTTGFQPAWFPGGEQIVYVTESVPAVESRFNVSELWIVPASGGEPKRLFAGDAVQPRVSPHAKRIAFWGVPADDTQKRMSGVNRDIWTVEADGTKPVRVTSDDGYDWNPCWSPDGRWLYFISSRSGSMNLWRVSIDEESGATRGEPQPLTAPASYIRHFSLAADGKVAAFATLTNNQNLGRVRFDANKGVVQGALESITSGQRGFGAIDVSPDGQQLVVVATSSGMQEDLYVMARDGSAARQLTNDIAQDRLPHWSPDGRDIISYSNRGGNPEIWTMNRDGSGMRERTKSDTRRYPIISRDGSMVAAMDAGTQMFIYDAHDFSKAPTIAAPFPAELGSLLVLDSWSPDGRLIAGSSDTGGVVYSLETKTYRGLGVGPVGYANWLPDGRRLLFASRGRLFVTDAFSGKPVEVFSIPGETVGFPSLTHDGSELYFEHGSAAGDIWTVRLDGEAGLKK